MAGSAVALEDGLAVLQVYCQGWPGGGHGCQQSKGSANGNWAPGSSRLRSSGGSTWLCHSTGTLLRRTAWCARRKDEAAGTVEGQRHCAHDAGNARHGQDETLLKTISPTPRAFKSCTTAVSKDTNRCRTCVKDPCRCDSEAG
eukprot:Skav227674  [mRNA]  locus=scaffold58:660685:661113:+ [translate_table: standard]